MVIETSLLLKSKRIQFIENISRPIRFFNLNSFLVLKFNRSAEKSKSSEQYVLQDIFSVLTKNYDVIYYRA